MRIIKMEYHNKALEWKLEPVDFSDLTLLVGVSGVGKTQILKALLDLKKITNGSSLNSLAWDIIFLTGDNREYRWQGEFENRGIHEFYDLLGKDDEDQIKNKPKIVYEKLFLNRKLIVDRDESEIILNESRTPKLSPFESVIKILNQEEEITPVYDSFNKIIQSHDLSASFNAIFSTEFDKLAKKHQSLKTIQESDLTTELKLALVYKHVPEVFNQIKRRFIDVFPQVEDIKLESIKQEGLPVFLVEYPFLQLKEKGIDHWIHQTRISSGMIKSLLHISELYVCADGTVILIDEFENSLGINCIDILTEDLLSENRNLQFIITSHHPYIINNIGMEHWKIVTRKGGVVTVKDAKDFNLGKSRHDAFIQLINLEEYKEGIAS